MTNIHSILYLIRNGSVIFLGKIESLKRVLCFVPGRLAKWNRSLAQFGSINRTWPNGKLTPHGKLMEYKDERCRKMRFRRPSASSEIVNIAQASFTSNKETADTEKQLHASQKKKWSRLRLSDLKRRIHRIFIVPAISPTLFFGMLFVNKRMSGCFL